MNVIRCVLLGDDGVGKTSLATSLAENRFSKNPVPSVYHLSVRKTLPTSTSTSTPYIFTLTDPHPASPPFTPILPKSRFAAISKTADPNYVYRPPLRIPDDADVFIVCFSVVDRASFASVRDRYIREARHFCAAVPCVVVGTKIDMREAAGRGGGGDANESVDEGLVIMAQGERMAWEVGAEAYAECSARTREGVLDVFDKAASAAVEYQAQKRRREREREEERELEFEVKRRRTKGCIVM
ncbi:P-loop containing nucleoside triphosphate hydrolase protein [Favolaschia claudopus]|uniref:P-loop containing nucleoside triphosphate hydrolase protein n=1 Tax=Favolaschia claudopus TaxID=2862362 RepID=A0AAW0BIW1_9AGAR